MSLDLAARREHLASLDAFAGARLVTLGDGAERGVRIIEMRAGGGLEAEIVVDRGLDIGRLALGGETVSWHAPGGYRAPALAPPEAQRGQGFLAAMSGFLATCGFDHIRQPATDSVASPSFPGGTVDHPLHGHGAHQPARLSGYGLDTERAVLWCEGEIVQSMFHYGALALYRRIEIPVGGGEIAISDRVENIGPTEMPVMLLYHFNVGHPLVGDGARVLLDPAEDLWASGDFDPRAPFGPPEPVQSAELTVHRPQPVDGWARCRLENPANGLSLTIAFEAATLPFLQHLKMRGRRSYMAAIEPCTTSRRERRAAREAGEVPVLAPGESRRFALRVTLTRSSVPSQR